jgi:DNA modification methylase
VNVTSDHRVLDQALGDGWALYRGDCVEVAKGLPDESVHLSLYSPPFSSLYTYSDSERDMGNCSGDGEFFEHYGYLLPELYRATVPGRLSAVHCKQLVDYKGRDGAAGLRDFRGEIIRAHERCGWKYHSEVCIWTDPVLEMQRTKSHGLLYKQLRKDSTYSRQGLAEYVVVFRKWPESEDEEAREEPVSHAKDDFPLEAWQRYASPVWTDIRRTDVLNVQLAREDRDEKHICPLQLGVIERCVELWTNPGDVVLDPFAGLGSTLVRSVEMGRRAVGIELKGSYFDRARINVGRAEASAGVGSLLDELPEAEGSPA